MAHPPPPPQPIHATKEYGGVKIYVHLFDTKHWGGGG